jgi:quinol monooxygenase YgiN
MDAGERASLSLRLTLRFSSKDQTREFLMSDAVHNTAKADQHANTTVLDPKAGQVTIVNTYVVEPERADELISFLVDSTLSTVRHVPGFISANLHIAHDRSQVVNYAQWQNAEALAAARDNPKLAALMQEQLQIAKSFSPVLYTLKASIPAG